MAWPKLNITSDKLDLRTLDTAMRPGAKILYNYSIDKFQRREIRNKSTV